MYELVCGNDSRESWKTDTVTTGSQQNITYVLSTDTIVYDLEWVLKVTAMILGSVVMQL